MWHASGMTDEGPRGLGALLHTDVEHVELGEHDGRRLRARIEHRTLRLAFGQAWSTGLTLGRRRAVAVEVRPIAAAFVPSDGGRTAPGSTTPGTYDVAIVAPPDPWAQAFRRIALVALGGWAVLRIAHRLRGRRDEGDFS